MGSGASIPADKHVVIVGAGYGGTALALSLLKEKANFTLVSPGDSFHHNIAAVRAVCVKGWAEKSLIPLETTFGAHFKKDKVTEIKPDTKQVVLSSGETLSYDILVIATGSVQKWPIKLLGPERDDRCKQYDALVEQVKAAKRVAVVGGGPTGVEIAAELRAEYPDMEVTLVHGSEHLLTPELTAKGQARLQDMLTKQFKIKLVLGERVENLSELPEEGPATIKTDKGTEIEADFVFRCTGLKLTTEAYANGLGDCMDEKTGALKVNEFLQVEGKDGIYALGDCSNVVETKLGFHAQEQAKVLIKTIKAVTTGCGQPVAYKPNGSPMRAMISVGPNNSFAETTGGWSVPGFVITNLKSKDLLCGRTWKEFHQTLTK